MNAQAQSAKTDNSELKEFLNCKGFSECRMEHIGVELKCENCERIWEFLTHTGEELNAFCRRIYKAILLCPECRNSVQIAGCQNE